MDDKTKTAIKEIGIPVTGAIASIFVPFAAVPLAGVSGVWTLIDKWRDGRINEVKKCVGDHKILDLIKRDDKTKDILNKILFNVLQEASEEKRKLYYSYIKQLHKGLHPSFDYHSKIILTINLITFNEIRTLIDFRDRYKEILLKAFEKDKKDNPTAKANESDARGVNLSEIRLLQYFLQKDEGILEDEFVNLGNYGLVSVKSGRMDGTFYGPLTQFGEIFVDFINEGDNDEN